jgi:hypothetical protein
MQQRMPGQPGMPGGVQRPYIAPNAPAMQGPAGILNRLGVPGRVGVPVVPGQRMPSAFPRGGQQPLSATQKKLPQLEKKKLPTDAR